VSKQFVFGFVTKNNVGIILSSILEFMFLLNSFSLLFGCW